MGIKLRLPDWMGGFSAAGNELKVLKSKGVRFVEVEIEHVEAALSHGLKHLNPQDQADAADSPVAAEPAAEAPVAVEGAAK
jgi:hypothetical protein